ncbi:MULTISPECIES: hypothetical protein [Streptomyces]|uniref:hypothetical protein n=1 Tax=Streptomyces TaxID=1883 RepID=UPI000A40E13C|nr:hypothetical protein [Streptomyces durhamensis]
MSVGAGPVSGGASAPDSYHPGLVEFLGAAIKVFAEQGSGFAPSAGAEASV